MDREKVIKQLENDAIATDTGYVEVPLWLFSEILTLLKEQEHKDKMYHALEEDWKRIKELLKEQEEWLRKFQKDKDKLCLEVSEWKHKYHDRPLKEQEIVRCKDCIYKEENPSPYWKYWCNRLKCGCDDDWFCADGERRTDDA